MNDLLDACEAAGYISMGVAIGMLVAGLLLGYLFGARDKLMQWLRKLAAPKEDAAADRGADGDDGADAEDEEVEAARTEELLLQFMNASWTSGLDDHPNTQFNPVLNYQIGKAKAALRERRALQALLMAHGYDPNHMETLDEAAHKKLLDELREGGDVKMAGTVGSVAGITRKYGATKNSTFILVQSGATLVKSSKAKSSSGSTDDKEKKMQQEVRERLKTIDQHLALIEDVDTTYADAKQRAALSAAHGGLPKSALEVARATKLQPYGGDAARRQEDMVQFAMRGRTRVGAPLDHAISAKNERDRRASCGARRASLSVAKKRSDEEEQDNSDLIDKQRGDAP